MNSHLLYALSGFGCGALTMLAAFALRHRWPCRRKLPASSLPGSLETSNARLEKRRAGTADSLLPVAFWNQENDPQFRGRAGK